MAESVFEQGVIDFENFLSKNVSVYTQCYTITWENTVMFKPQSFHERECTLVLTADGEVMLVDQPICRMIKNFALRMEITDFETRLFARRIGISKYRPCARCHHGMFPVRGTTAEDNIWIMRHAISDYNEIRNTGMLYIIFNDHVKVKVQMSMHAFKQRIKSVDEIGKIQAACNQKSDLDFGMDEFAELHGEYAVEHQHLKDERYSLLTVCVEAAELLGRDVFRHANGANFEENMQLWDESVKNIITKPFSG